MNKIKRMVRNLVNVYLSKSEYFEKLLVFFINYIKWDFSIVLELQVD